MGQNWTLGEKERKGIKKVVEKAVLVGVIRQGQTEEQAKDYLSELKFLAETAGAITLKTFVQRMPQPHKATFVGKGKLQEIKDYVEEKEIDLAIFDDDLTGKQVNNIEEELEIKILDRSTLILDIFASRAQTAQAKTQVELAQMQYLLPRLRGMWTHLERQRGGIGMRGPGEKEIETDRRIIRDKIALIKKQLEKVDKQSKNRRKNRGQMIRVSLVGYTNAGKSTTMNLLSKSEVFAENKLFATLDTTVRKVVFGRMPFLLSDTVGFIRKLPHHLVESFKSTLDEVRESDILVHLVDISHPNYEDHIATVNNTLIDLGASDKPTLLVFNKMDLYRKRYFDEMLEDKMKQEIEAELLENMKNNYSRNSLFISAITKENIEEFRMMLGYMVNEQYEVRYPYKAKFW